MAAIAIVDNTKGIFIPVFKETFNVNNTSMGMMLSVCSLGYILFTYVGGLFCEKIGQRNVIYIGLISIIISVLIVAASKFYGMRSLLLKAKGYNVSVVEYISPLETPKNLMIRAIKEKDEDSDAMDEYMTMMSSLNVYPALYDLLNQW